MRRYLGLSEGPAPGEDWTSLLDRATEEGLRGLLAWTFPEHLGPQFHNDFARCAMQMAGLREIADALPVPVMALKGAALTQLAYGNVLGIRPLFDLDLLVRDRKPAEETLQRLGFRPVGSSWERGQLIVDLHGSLLSTERLSTRKLAYNIDEDELWRRSVPLLGPVRCLAPEHLFVHLCIHGVKHAFSRLIWLLDLAVLKRDIDARSVLEFARASGSLRTVAVSLTILHDLLGTSMWPELPRLHPLEQTLVRKVCARAAAGALGEAIVAFGIPKWADRVRYLAELGFPRPAVLRASGPPTSLPGLYLRRAWQIAREILRAR